MLIVDDHAENRYLPERLPETGQMIVMSAETDKVALENNDVDRANGFFYALFSSGSSVENL